MLGVRKADDEANEGMDQIAWDELWRDATAFDAAVAVTPRIDRYCSSSLWTLPAHEAFHPTHEPFVLRSAAGWGAFCFGETPTIGRYLAPLESMWGLACPLVGDASERLAYDFFRTAFAHRARWDALWIGGLHRESVMFRSLASLFQTTCSVRWGPESRRYATDLTGGWDGWLGRRSAHFRANLRRALRQAEGEGVAFTPIATPPDTDPAAIYGRVLAIEGRSWKGLEDAGFSSGAMNVFYRHAFDRLVPNAGLRGIIARRENEDIGFVFGGVFQDTYRGLQMSFDDRFRHLSLGNVLQAQMIRALAAEGVAIYDLGSEIEYKSRWSEPGITTVTLVVLRR